MNIIDLFVSAPLDLKLKRGEIHIWRARLDEDLSRSETLWQMLSEEELERAGRFRFEKDRWRFVCRHGLLREILGRYLNIEPGRLGFRYGKKGKPRLAGAPGNRTIHFSMSHSYGLALYAFSRDFEMGVDVEQVKDFSEMDRIAQGVFSAREYSDFILLPDSRRKREEFFCRWTCKEAFVKAIGEGLGYPLDKVCVSSVVGEFERVSTTDEKSVAALEWSVHNLRMEGGYVGAFAVAGDGWRVRFLQPRDQEKGQKVALPLKALMHGEKVLVV